MRKYALVVVAVLALAPFSAQAAKLIVTYSTTAVINLPVLGIQVGTSAGTMTVVYANATGPVGSGSIGEPLPGKANVLGGTFAGTLNFTALGDTFTGSFSGSRVKAGGPAGTLPGGGTLFLPIKSAASGIIHCSGATCTNPLIGIPPSIPVPFTLSAVGTALATGATVAGILQSTFTFGAATIGTFAGFPITAVLTASEVSRHFVPEPTTLPLLALGLAGIAGVRRSVRRR